MTHGHVPCALVQYEEEILQLFCPVHAGRPAEGWAGFGSMTAVILAPKLVVAVVAVVWHLGVTDRAQSPTFDPTNNNRRPGPAPFTPQPSRDPVTGPRI